MRKEDKLIQYEKALSTGGGMGMLPYPCDGCGKEIDVPADLLDDNGKIYCGKCPQSDEREDALPLLSRCCTGQMGKAMKRAREMVGTSR